MSRDPIGEVSGMNLYGYAGNDSVNLVDVSGTIPQRPGFDQRAEIYRAIRAIGEAGFPQLAERLEDKLFSREILVDPSLPSNVAGQVDPSYPTNIALNPALLPHANCTRTQADLAATLAHEYVHTVQYRTWGGYAFFSLLNLPPGPRTPTEQMAYTLADLVKDAVQRRSCQCPSQ
jgi:hypothetical protein